MRTIITFDIGIASVGWAIIDLDTEAVIEAGVNIFSAAEASQNALRRSMRGSRRLNRRRSTRLKDFEKLWVMCGMSIPSSFATELVQLKNRALNERISLEELYIILYAELKNRGISYLDDAEDDSKKSSNLYARGIAYNQEQLKNKYPCQIQLERLIKYGKYRGTNSITVEDEKIDLSNVFTCAAYRAEILRFFEVQKQFYTEITDDLINGYFMIFNRKRKYYEGPGNEKSRTDYGIFTTGMDADGNYITEKNIFEKLIGKCSVYPEEYRGAMASYTAEEYNFLNDMNNLTINKRKLTCEEKKKLAERIKTSEKAPNMRKLISEVMGEKIEEFSGAREDKQGKELFHTFPVYRGMRKALAEIGRNIEELSRDELDEIGHIWTLNRDRESVLEALNAVECTITLDEEVINRLLEFRKADSNNLFGKWHSFSIRIMKELIPEMYEQPKEQMTLLTEMGYFGNRKDLFAGMTNIPSNILDEELLNPVVRRSVRITFRVFNALLEKYGMPERVVIEMPRDRNTEEEKQAINDRQATNEKEKEYIEKELKSLGIELSKKYFNAQKNLWLKLKLWNEQGGVCLYSGVAINPKDIMEHPDMFDIDHIIPISISYSDARSNKVLVYKDENRQKGNMTPYQYLSGKSDWNYDKFRSMVLQLAKSKDYPLSKAKVRNLLFTENITKNEVRQGFINRNLNDTRYASRLILNTLQSFFAAQESSTAVTVINGNFTHQMRVNMKLDKDRDATFSHHAVDAMLIAYSQMGYDAFRKLQGTFIDFETGEILDKRVYEEKMSAEAYQDFLYGNRWATIHNNITEAEKHVRYWFRVDRKCNRSLCNQTIRGTREYDSKTYKINKIDIRTTKKEELETLKKLFSEKKREQLLVYKHDRQTFDVLVQILVEYADASNPFIQYEKETGDTIRKYAKKHNGPKITSLKYTDREVGECIDVSHKYGFKKGCRKVILESLSPYRTDVYYKADENRYFFVGLKHSHIKCENGRYVIDEDAYTAALLNEKMISEGKCREDLPDLGYEFMFSLFKNDIIEYEKDGKVFRERFLSRTMPQKSGYIETKPLTAQKFSSSKQHLVGLSKATSVKKIVCDILGKEYLCGREKFTRFAD